MKDYILMAVIVITLAILLAAAVMISFYTTTQYCLNTPWDEMEKSRCASKQ